MNFPFRADRQKPAGETGHRPSRQFVIGVKEAIYLDSGSTVLQLAKLLKDRSDLVIVTNRCRSWPS